MGGKKLNRFSKKLVSIVAMTSVIISVFPLGTAMAYDKSQTVHMLGGAHIDAAWNWRYEEVIRQVIPDSFNRALDNMDKNPDYHYSQSSSKYYQWAEEYYPELAAKIKEKVKNGQWEIVGGQVVETDLNVPSGESLVRQSLYAQNYFKDTYGVAPKVGWVPDVFGFNYNMPQILQKSGMEYFMTTKLNWNDTNKWPYEVFNWVGPDGSKVLTYKPTYDYSISGSDLTKDRVSSTMNYPASLGLKDSMLMYGAGDHGGGPTSTDIQNLRNINSDSTAPNVKLDSAIDSFKILEKDKDKVPTVNDELYLEYHRGTLTSAAYMKKYNRDSEIKAEEAEKFSSIATMLGTGAYPQAKINKAWDKTNLNQFHDVLPGSSITPVYADAFNDAEIALNQLNTSVKNAVKGIASRVNTEGEGKAIVLYNPLSWDREDMIESVINVSSNDKNVVILDDSGKEVPSQIVSRAGAKVTVSYKAKVPAMGYTVYRALEKANTNSNTTLKVDNTNKIIENQFFILKLDPKTGNISSLFDKKNNKEVFEAGKQGNELHILEDTPKNWDAWDIDGDDAKANPTVINDVAFIELVEQGPAKATFRVKKNWSLSAFTQDITLYSDIDRVDVGMNVDWKETQKLLKVAFPMNISNPEKATYEIAYSAIDRSTAKNTAKFEYSGHKWADISKDGYGVSILNDSKYGWNTFGNVMRLTLLKSAKDRGGIEDRGAQKIKYSIYPHSGDWKAANTVQKGYEFNYPVITQEEDSHKGDLAKTLSFGKVDKDNIVLSVLKKAEKSNDYIVRLYEAEGKDSTDVNITLPTTITAAKETNLIEDELSGAPAPGISGNILSTTLKKFEIKTFKVNFDNSSVFKDTKPTVKSIDLTSAFNLDGITSDKNRKDGNFNGKGETFSAELMPSNVVSEDISFNIGPKEDGKNNFVQALGQTINVTGNEKHKFLYILGAAAGGLNSGDFKVNYKDGSATTKNISFTDWQAVIGNDQKTYVKDNIAINLTHTHIPTGNTYDIDNNLFVYRIALDADKEIKNINLPQAVGIKISAMSFVDGDVLASGDTEAPSKVTNLKLTAPKQYYSPYLDLTWDAATDNIGVSNYTVYRATKADLSDIQPIAMTETNSYKDENVDSLAIYYYLVKATDEEGNVGAFSEQVSHYAGGNIALGAKATADHSVNSSEAPEKAVDGNINTKWCANTSNVTHWITLDLGRERTIDGLKIYHAGAGGEDTAWNTRDFNIAIGNDPSNLTVVKTITGNTQSITEHLLDSPVKGRYVKISAPKPTSTTDPATRLYEIKVYGNDADFPKSVPEAPILKTPYQSNTSVIVGFEQSPTADSYTLEYGSEPGKYTSTITNIKDSSVTVDGLTVGKTYYFRIIPINILGQGTPSNEVSFEVKKLAITTVDLDKYYNLDGIATLAVKTDGNFDGVGWAFDAATIPDVIKFGNLEYKTGPKTGSDPNVVKASGQTIELPSTNASDIFLLSSATNGNQTGNFVVTYEDGSTISKSLTISDWCSTSPTSSEKVVLSIDHRISNSQGSVGPAVKIFATSISIDNTKKVKSITLPNNGNIKLFGLTLIGYEDVLPTYNNALLNEIKIGNTPLDNFKQDTFEYNVTLPWNTKDVPLVSATAENPKAAVKITQADKLPGTALIEVKAEDGVTTKIYKINFQIQPSLDKVELSASSLIIERTKNTTLNLKGILTNGETVDTSKLNVQYTIGNPEVISVENNVISAKKVGESTIKALATFDGKVVESNVITIKVNELSMDPIVTSLETDKRAIKAGDEVQVKVNADKANNLAGFDLSMAYNSELFELAKVDVDSKFKFNDKKDSDGRIKVIGTIVGDDEPINGKTSLVTFTFKAKKVAKTMDFVLAKGATYTDLKGGLFTSDKDITATVKELANPDFTGDGRVLINDLAIIAKQFGKEFNPVYDLNYDGVVDIQDIVYVALIVLEN